jgi:NAD dependent epimerase/dehydratase
MKMKIEGSEVLVTGAGGFIGSHLTEALVERGAKVKVMVHYNSRNDWAMLEEVPDDVRQELEVVPGDVRDPVSVKHAVEGVDVVFHLASLIAIPYSYRAPGSYMETNIHGALNIMQASLEWNVQKVVHTSTSEVYGTARYTPIDEEHPLQAQSPYSASKIGADKLVESFHLSFDLPVATIRPFNTYGPRQSARAVIPTIICQALSTDHIELGLLTPVRDLTFVRDTVDGFVQIAESDDAIGEVLNIGSGTGASIEELGHMILDEMGLKKTFVTIEDRLRPPESEVMNLISDNRKAKDILGWEPKVTLREGIRETIEYYRENIHRYKPEIYNI